MILKKNAERKSVLVKREVIGNPFGFSVQNPESTVTVGVISALHRSLGRLLSRERDYFRVEG